MVKQTSRKLAAKLVHPNSRKAVRIVKNNLWKAKKESRRQNGCHNARVLAERIVWAKRNISDQQVFSPEQISQLILRYIERNDAQMQQLEGEHLRHTQCEAVRSRQNKEGGARQRTALYLKLQESRSASMKLFNTTGFEFPDLSSSETVLDVRLWNGQVGRAQAIKCRHFINCLHHTPAT